MLRLSSAKNSPKGYAAKLKKNAVPPLDATTLLADADADVLTGRAGIDWFFADELDSAADRAANEAINT